MSVQIKKEPGSIGSCGSGPGSVGQLPDDKDLVTACSSPGTYGVMKAQLASKVKLTLMQAWRERWTEIQWVIQLKKLMAAYSAESVDIAEILMQQALVGSSPNSLILSYLKHSVLSLMIPFHSVLKYITNFDDFSRPYCVLALLHLAETFGSKISLSPCHDSPLQLVRTMLKLSHWLVKALLICLQKIQENRDGAVGQERERPAGQEFMVILSNASSSICHILERQAVKSLLQIAMADSAEDYREFEQCQMNARGTLSQLPASQLSEEIRDKIGKALSSLSRIEEQQISTEPVLEVSHSSISPSIHGLVFLEAILSSSADTQLFVDQLLAVSRLSKMPMHHVCLEIFRACFMGFLDTNDYQESLEWATFTFLKVPQILSKMKQQMPDQDLISDVETGFEMLLEYSYLLDQTDIKENCDILTMLITECHKAGLLNDAQKASLAQKRSEQRSKIHFLENPGSASGKNVNRVPNADATVTSILKSLGSDPAKNSETLVKVLNMLSGHSFELLRLAASCMGRMHDFVTKLIRINEFASHSTNEQPRNPIRSQLFDATYLMITSIIQQNGIEIVQPIKENEFSLVVQWSRRWLPEEGRYKNCEMTGMEDQDKIDCILNMMLNNAEIIPYGPVSNWKELITHFPYAIQEVLYAFEHKSLQMEEVKSIIDSIRKQKMNCLVLVGATYLCSYMNLVGQNARAKPMWMLEFLTQTHNPEGKQPVQMINTVIDGIIFDILPENHPQRSVKRYLLPRNKLTSETMHETLKESFHRGWLDMASLHTLDQLLALRGPEWFCSEIVEHLIEESHIEDTSQSLAVSFALMHMDLERMTIALLHRVQPKLLTNSDPNMLTAPRGHSLTKLCVLCITATRTSKIGQKEPYVRRLRKRNIMETEFEEDLDDSDASPSKLRKMSETQLTFSLEDFNLDIPIDKEEAETFPTFVMKEPLNKALVNLFHLMNSILQLPTLTPRTWFTISFIQEAIKCGGQHTRFILQFMPPTMLSQMMRSLPGVFTNDQILRICDLSIPAGRKIAAKVICNSAQQITLFD